MSDTTLSGVSADGTAYDLSGPEGAPVIALIHGLGLCREIWKEHIPHFAKRYRVLNYDLYGHGESQPPPSTASLSVYSDQLASLLESLCLSNATVIGFSIGGMINRRFALDHAHHLNALVILNSPHDRGEQAQEQVEQRAAKVREQGAMATLEEALKRWFTPDYLNKLEGIQRVRDWREQVDADSYAQAAWVLANGVRELIKPEPAVEAPTLVMTCENDSGSTPAMSHAIAAEIKNAQIIIVPKLQHLGLLEQPDVFTQPILKFLDEQLT